MKKRNSQLPAQDHVPQTLFELGMYFQVTGCDLNKLRNDPTFSDADYLITRNQIWENLFNILCEQKEEYRDYLTQCYQSGWDESQQSYEDTVKPKPTRQKIKV